MVKTFVDGILLPVNPFDDITFDAKTNNKRMEIVSLGDISLLGSRGLYTVSIKSLFTDNVYPWSSTDSPRPAQYYVDFLRDRQSAERPIRLVIVGDGLDVNMLFSIESFSTTQAHGETNEFYYSFSLMEYREPSITRLDIIPDELLRPKAKTTTARPDTKPQAKTWTVKKGEALSGIAQSCYSDGSKYPQIYQANQTMMDAYNRKHNMPKYTIYPGWNLVIP